MFKDRELALQIRESLMNVDALLTRSVQIVEASQCSSEEKKTFYKKVGRITAIAYIESLEEIFAIHPDLASQEYLDSQ
jgi:lantibiotic modifying enzyme